MATAFSWPDPTAGDLEKIDDLRHSAFNGRGLFSSANDSLAFQTAVDTILNDIKSNSGTATAVAFNTQEVEAGALVFRASFNTKTNTGNLVAQRINSNGSIDSSIFWDAAEELDDKVTSNSDTRTIITYKDTGSSTSIGIPFSWGSLTTGMGSQQELLDNPQPTNISTASNTFGDERLGYIRGHSINEGTSGDDGEFRERVTVAGKLGDIVHSTPVYVGKPQYIGRDYGAYPATNHYSDFVTAYQNRTPLVYAGANDGMLHAFKAGDGSELFAYVPNLVFDNLKYLADSAYEHLFYVDQTPSVKQGERLLGTTGVQTMLVGGLGKGGKGYYALNGTDPDMVRRWFVRFLGA